MKILIIYYSKYVYPLRSTIRDHLYCFEKWTDHLCYYHNSARGALPKTLTKVHFDLIIYHTTFLAKRIRAYEFSKLCRNLERICNAGKFRLMLPQDEFINTDSLCDFIENFKITHVFTVAPISEWDKIYKGVDRRKVIFSQLLTGYLDEATLKIIASQSETDRSIDIGYRAWHAEPWFGKHGLLKVKIAEEFLIHSLQYPIKVDISTRQEDNISGNEWYHFLARCKYTIGVEGGASLLDTDGSLRERTLAYIKEHPDADFELIESQCFPNRDGELKLQALSPRHLEACATKTCQILIEGSYNDILKPWVHYIPLKSDFSNIHEVLAYVVKDEFRENIVNQAYSDIVLTKKYTYQSMLESIFALISLDAESQGSVTGYDRCIHLLCRYRDQAGWWREAVLNKPLLLLSKRFAPTLLQILQRIRLNWQKSGRFI